GIPLHF
ncbi:hypothetical protein D043_0985B, partial [Vibrio parahaemolyticus EKP-021]